MLRHLVVPAGQDLLLLWRPAAHTAYTLKRAGVYVTVMTAGGAISFSQVIVAVFCFFFFGQLLVDEIIESLSRPASAFRQITAIAAQEQELFQPRQEQLFSLFLMLAGICAVFTTRGIICIVTAKVRAGIFIALVIGGAVVFHVFFQG